MTNPNTDLKKRVALVTGASRGLGAAISKKLAACGARVAVNYFGSEGLARGVVDLIKSAGGTAEAFAADVRDEAAIGRMVIAIERVWGPIEIVVANATGPQPMLRLEDLSWRRMSRPVGVLRQKPGTSGPGDRAENEAAPLRAVH